MDVENDYYTNTSGSCTKEQAVAKLIGWSIGPLFKRRIHVTESGIQESDLFWVEHFEGGIDAQLELMLRSAQNKAILGLENGARHDELTQRERDIDRVKLLISRVHSIRMSIDDELAKGPGSGLRIDAGRTIEERQECITLMSLNRWAQENFGQSTLETKASLDQPGPRTAADEAVISGDGQDDAKGTRLMIVISLLTDVVTDLHSARYRHPDGSVNISALANRMSELAKSRKIEKQGPEKLRKILADAANLSRQEGSLKASRS